jgi:HEPN domain-containing protein
MVLESLVLAAALGLNPDNAKADTYLIEVPENEPIVIVSPESSKSKRNRAINTAKNFYANACREFDEGQYDFAATDVMECFRLYPGKTESKEMKTKALQIIIKYAEVLKSHNRQSDRISALINLCDYDLTGIPNGHVPAEILSREYPDPKKREEYAKLAERLRNSVRTAQVSSTTYR